MKRVYLNERAAKIIKNTLKRKGLTQEVFAEEYLFVTYRTLQNWLSTKKPIPIHKMDDFQSLTEMSIQQLFGSIPSEYEEKVSIATILKNIFNPSYIKEFQRVYRNYADFIVTRFSFNPYPIKGTFQCVEHNVARNGNSYYSNISIIIPSRKIPEGDVIKIGYIMLVGRVRFDYGWMSIIDKKIYVAELATEMVSKDYSRYSVPIDIDRFEKTGVLFEIATWFGNENCTFIIQSKKGTDFTAKNNGRIDMPEEDVLKMRGFSKVVF